MTFILVFGWAICSTLSYGMMFAEFQSIGSDLPGFTAARRRKDMAAAMLPSIFAGPVALVFAFFFTGFAEHGFKFR